MSIVTKTGDRGETSLYKGKRVTKDHLRIEICGTLDELNSYLGLCKALAKNRKIKKIIELIQKDLFVIGAEIATENKFLKELKQRLNSKFIERLEQIISQLEIKQPLKRACFSLPGRDLFSSALDVARTIARKAERRVVKLKKKKLLKNTYILVYLNRLSDLIYLLEQIAAKQSPAK